MSIYFQYPTIDEYPNLSYPVKIEVVDQKDSKNEDSLNQEQIMELKDFLTLKPV
ncbi:hypothetical protein [Pedobacter chinensis]|uniref:hypothetical protein n=1 Tax=Pedobacter chinensis TaxID=2282421 RepID=UPI0013144BC3|nr:hypothetical protein [Pedobacter chinensis]